MGPPKRRDPRDGAHSAGVLYPSTVRREFCRSGRNTRYSYKANRLNADS